MNQFQGSNYESEKQMKNIRNLMTNE